MSEHAFPTEARNVVDLRSDTVTRPTPEMFEAMLAMPVGDDVLGDDPTVKRLEALAALKTGKEAGLFVPSGTMSNQLALAAHCQPGEAILIEEDAHILYYEVGAPALIAGVVSWTLPSHRGAMDPGHVEARILKGSDHTPRTSLICLENTHNRAGGAIIPQTKMAAYREVASRNGVSIHLDGARLFNASVAQGIEAKEITQYVDSVSICLSKGLRSPVGSVLCGSTALIDKARHWRKRLGGGMRQSGVLAACGIVSLEQMVDRLAEDHAKAKRLAQAIGDLHGFGTSVTDTETNMVLVDTDQPAEVVQAMLQNEGVLCFPVAANRLRLVTHADITDAMVDRAIEAFTHLSQH